MERPRLCWQGPRCQWPHQTLVEPSRSEMPILASGVSGFGTFSTEEARSGGLPLLGAPQTLGGRSIEGRPPAPAVLEAEANSCITRQNLRCYFGGDCHRHQQCFCG